MAESAKLEGGNLHEVRVGLNPRAPHPLYKTLITVCDMKHA